MDKFLVKYNNTYPEERRYILRYILNDILGVEYDVEESPVRDTEITFPTDNVNKKLVIADELFTTPDADWLTAASLPEAPLLRWKPETSDVRVDQLPNELPVIYGRYLEDDSLLRIDETRIESGIDIFGSAFFMLTRYEELVKEDRDQHERFPLEAMLCNREQFCHLPIVNCYIELLWYMINRLWNRFERKQRSFRVTVSHDVDNPLSYAWKPASATFRSTAGDLIKRRSLKTAASRLIVASASRMGYFDRAANVSEKILRLDPAFNLDRIMDISEKHNLKGCFNFIAGHSGGEIDGSYSLRWKWIQKLLVNINARGHEIGLHPSYNSFKNSDLIKREFHELKNACLKNGIGQSKWGGRQHYLRWSNPETWRYWDEAGLDYDSTLGFAEEPGFRCGICYEYPVFDLLRKRRLNLFERPLIIMDASVLDYMNCSFRELAEETIRFSDIVKKFAGEFTLLHHNCRLASEKERSIYEDTLRNICHG